MPLNENILYILDTDLGLQCSPFDENKLIFSSALRQLQVDRSPIEYHTLSQAPQLFLAPSVMALIGEDMLDVFPLTVRNGRVLKRGAYPDVDELEAWLDITLLPLNVEKEKELLALCAVEGNELASCCNRSGGCASCGGGACDMDADDWNA